MRAFRQVITVILFGFLAINHAAGQTVSAGMRDIADEPGGILRATTVHFHAQQDDYVWSDAHQRLRSARPGVKTTSEGLQQSAGGALTDGRSGAASDANRTGTTGPDSSPVVNVPTSAAEPYAIGDVSYFVKFADGAKVSLDEGRITAVELPDRNGLATDVAASSWQSLRNIGALQQGRWEFVNTGAAEAELVRRWQNSEAYWQERFADPRTEFRLITTQPLEAADLRQLRQLPGIEEVTQERVGGSAGSPRRGAAITSDGLGAAAVADGSVTADATPAWMATINVPTVWTDRGITGRQAQVAVLAQGVPDLTGLPPIALLGNFGNAPTAYEKSRFQTLAEAAPNVRLYAVSAFDAVLNPMFASAIKDILNFSCAARNVPGCFLPGTVIVIPWHEVACTGPANADGTLQYCDPKYPMYDVPVELERQANLAIKNAVANGFVVLEEAGNSNLDLLVKGQELLASNPAYFGPHRPFISDSGAIIVAQGYQQNKGLRVNFIAPAISDTISSTGAAMYGAVATLVQSAIRNLHFSTDQRAYSVLNGIEMRARALGDPTRAIRDTLALEEPSPSFRMQSGLPDALPIAKGGIVTLAPLSRSETRLLEYQFFNDGAQALHLSSATLAVTRGPDKEACVWYQDGPNATLNNGQSKAFKVKVAPLSEGQYECKVTVNTDDPSLPIVSTTNARSNSFTLKFQAQGTPGVRTEVLDVTGMSLPNGYTLGFGNLAAASTANSQVRSNIVFVVRNKENSTEDLIISGAGVAHSEPQFKLRYSTGLLIDGLISGFSDVGSSTIIRVEPGNVVYFQVLMIQNYDLGPSIGAKDFTQTYTLHTNDSNPELQNFKLNITGRLSSREKWFTFFGIKGNLEVPIPGISSEAVITYDLGDIEVNQRAPLYKKEIYRLQADVANVAVTFKDVSENYNKLIPDPQPENPFIKGDPKAKKIGIIESFSRTLTLLTKVQLIADYVDQNLKAGTRARTVIQMRAERNNEVRYYYLIVTARPYTLGPKGMRFFPIDFNPAAPGKSAELEGKTAYPPIPIGTEVFLGRTQLEKPLMRTFQIRNENSQTVYLSDVRLEGSGFAYQLLDTSIGPGSYAELRVIMTADTAGAQSAGLSFEADTDPPSFTERMYTVDLTGFVCLSESDCGAPGGGGNSTLELNYSPSPGPILPEHYIANNGSLDFYTIKDGNGQPIGGTLAFEIYNDGTANIELKDFTIDRTADMAVTFTQPQTNLGPNQLAHFVISGVDQTRNVRSRATVSFHYRFNNGDWNWYLGYLFFGPPILETVPDLTLRLEDSAGNALPYALRNGDGSLPASAASTSFGWFDLGTVSPGWIWINKPFYVRNTSARPVVLRPIWVGTGRTGNDQPVLWEGWGTWSGDAAGVTLQPNQRVEWSVQHLSNLHREVDPNGHLFLPERTGAWLAAFSDVGAPVGRANTIWMPLRATLVDGPFAVVRMMSEEPHVRRESLYVGSARVNRERRFTAAIHNTGNANLIIGRLAISGTGYRIVKQPAHLTIRPGAWEAFTVGLQAASAGIYDGAVTFTTNDARKSYSVALRGTVSLDAPKSALTVFQGDEVLENGGTFDASGPTLFRIRNDGVLPVQFTGLDASGTFEVASDVPSIIQPNETGSFEIRNAASGPRDLDAPGLITISSDDLETPEFLLYANGKPVAADDAVAVNPGSAADIRVLENDSDPDADALAVVNAAVVAPARGSAVRLDDSTIRYTAPSSGDGTTDTFQYEIGDGSGRRSRAWVTVTIGANRKPVAEGDAATTDLDTAVQIDVGNNDWDPDGEKPFLTAAPITTAPLHGTTAKVGDLSVRYTPSSGFAGADQFEYEITDGRGLRARAWGSVQVGASNNAPIAMDDVLAIDSNGAGVRINVTGNDSDPDRDRVRLTSQPVVSAPDQGGSVLRLSDGAVSYTARSGFVGDESFTYEIEDGRGGTARAAVIVHVGATNHAPTAVADVAATAVDSATQIAVLANDADPDGDTIWLVRTPIVVAPLHGTAVRVSDTTVAYVPSNGYSGTDAFTYEIRDLRDARSRATVSITVAGSNRAPVANPDSATTAPGTPVRISVLANDSDPDGDALNLLQQPIVWLPSHGSAVRLSNTEIEYTPQGRFSGVDTFEYRVGDGRGARADGRVTITVGTANHPPDASPDAAHTAIGAAVEIDAVANDSDPDGDALSLAADAIVRFPSHGTAMRTSDRTFRYTPSSRFSGTDSFQYRVVDGRGNRATGIVTVAVGVNHAPVAKPDLATVSAGRSSTIVVTPNDSDPDGDAVALLAITAAPQHGSAVISSKSSISYTPAASYVGSDSFAYSIGDAYDGVGEGVVTINVVDSSNRAPVAVDDAAIVAAAGSVSISVLSNDFDPDGTPVTLSGVVVAPQNGVVSVVGSSIVYSAFDGFHGGDSFDYEITDAKGAKARGHVTVTMASSNGAPTARPDEAWTAMNEPVVIDLLQNDSDPNADSLQIINPKAVAPRFGEIVLVDQRRVRYTPDANVVGTDAFSYEVSDGSGATARANVTVNVVEVFLNHAPVAVDDDLTSAPDAGVSLAVTANDTDPDGNQVRLTTSPITAPPAHGTAWRIDERTIGYAPAPGYVGVDQIQYEITDGNGLYAQGVVTVRLNHPPVAADDSAQTSINTEVNVKPLLNDSDADRHSLAIARFGPAALGTVSLADAQTLRYVPKPYVTGTDTFDYTIVDQLGAEATGRITIVIQNRLPVAAADSTTTNGSTAVTVDVLANDGDPDGDPIALATPATTAVPASGAAITRVDNTSLRYTPRNGFVGSEVIPYVVQDNRGGSSTGSLSVTVQNRPPVAVNDNATAPFDTAIFVNVLANDFDPDGHAITLVADQTTWATSGGGKAERYSNSDVRYTPKTGMTGSDTFTYTVADAFGGRTTGTVVINIANRPPVAVSDSYVTTGSAAIRLTVMTNDSDPDGGALTLPATVPIPQYGSLQLDSYTAYVYTPRPGFVGTDTFRYQVKDAAGALSGFATVTIQVNSDNAQRRQAAANAALSQTSVSVNWTYPTQAGSLLVAVISAANSAYPIATFTTPSGWQLAKAYEWNNIKTAIYYYPNNPGGRASETFMTTGVFRDQILQVAEYTGMAANAVLDQTAVTGSGSSSGTLTAGNTPPTTQARELVITALTTYAATGFSNPTSSFMEVLDQTAGNSLSTAVHERVVSTTGSYGHTATVNTSAQWLGIAVTFRSASPN